MTDGGEGAAAEVDLESEVEGEFDSVGGSALFDGTNCVTGEEVRSTTGDDGGGVGSAVVCSHCYVVVTAVLSHSPMMTDEVTEVVGIGTAVTDKSL